MDWIYVMQEKGDGWDLVNTTLYVRVTQRASNFLSKDCAALN